MTLGSLLRHLAHAEHHRFSTYLTGAEPQPPWDTSESREADWHLAADASPEQLRQMWHEAVARSQSLTAQVLASGGLNQASRPPWDEGIGTPSPRWIVCHMIEEYDHHLGHADLIHESIDGSVGEDPGWD